MFIVFYTLFEHSNCIRVYARSYMLVYIYIDKKFCKNIIRYKM